MCSTDTWFTWNLHSKGGTCSQESKNPIESKQQNVKKLLEPVSYFHLIDRKILSEKNHI